MGGINTIDATGDIFLMISLSLFAGIWCDNVALLRSRCGLASAEEKFSGLRVIRYAYALIAFITIPIAIAFAASTYDSEIFDRVAIAYVGSGVVSGFFILTPVAIHMKRVMAYLPSSASLDENYSRLNTMAKINLWEQLLWNALALVAIIALSKFLEDEEGEESGSLIGLASICVQVC